MIVVDSSALIAILFDEPEKQAFETIVAGSRPMPVLTRAAIAANVR
jgi:uncharacterized protein with PIN domain